MKLHFTAAMAALATASCAMSAAAQNPADPEKNFVPVELQCPVGNTGNFILILKNRSGDAVRIRTTFINGVPEDNYYDYAPSGQPYRIEGRFTARHGGNEYGENAALLGNTVFMEVCEGSAEAQQRYMSKLAANAESLRAPGR